MVTDSKVELSNGNQYPIIALPWGMNFWPPQTGKMGNGWLYLYNYAAQPWKSQYWTREIMDKLYKPTPDGYCGDEDNGKTSAWYVFSALGFYPVCPGTDQYVIGSPLFPEVKIQLENRKQININAKNNGQNNRYIKSLNFNKKLYTKNWISHQTLMGGAVLNFEMSANPDEHRGVKPGDAPFSLSGSENTSKR